MASSEHPVVVSGGRSYVAVGCTSGIYVSPRGQEGESLPTFFLPSFNTHLDFKKVLSLSNPTAMAAVQTYRDKVFNKFVVHHENSLVSYSLDLIARVSLGQVEHKVLNASLEKISGHPNNVIFFRHAHVGPRVLSA